MRFWKGKAKTIAITSKVLNFAGCLLLATAISTVFSSPARAVVFTQETFSTHQSSGASSQVVLNPATLSQMQTHQFDLGHGRQLEIQTNLPSSRQYELSEVAAVVRDCYQYLEAETGRTVDGGVLLYLLQFPQRPRYYKFSVEVPDSSQWNEVRVALLDEDQPLLGRRASRHVTEFLFDTLPHELTHSLLANTPTVRHDLDGKRSCGTRWFIEGVCEKMAKGFGAAAYAQGHSGSTITSGRNSSFPSEVQQKIWTWGQESGFEPAQETRCYELARWLVSAWCSEIELSRLLEVMHGSGGDTDGEDLLTLLAETTGWQESRLLYRAHILHQEFLVPLQMSQLR